MEIGGIGRNYPALTVGKDAASAGVDGAVQPGQQASPAQEQYDRLVHGLTKLKEATNDADEEAKARAKQKLKDAAEQLKFLQRWGFDPEVVARQAAQLGAVVAAAAREFTEALAEGGGAALSLDAASPAVDAGSETILAETGQQDNAATEEPTETPKESNPYLQAYKDVMDDDKPSQTSRLSPDDIRTAMEFSSIAQQIKALLEQAARKLREQNDPAATPGTQGLDAAVTALTNTVAVPPAISITI